MRHGKTIDCVTYHVNACKKGMKGESGEIACEKRDLRTQNSELHQQASPRCRADGHQYKARHPEILVIGLSVNVGSENAEAMKKAGAAMLLTKEAAVGERYESIQEVFQGKGVEKGVKG